VRTSELGDHSNGCRCVPMHIFICARIEHSQVHGTDIPHVQCSVVTECSGTERDASRRFTHSSRKRKHNLLLDINIRSKQSSLGYRVFTDRHVLLTTSWIHNSVSEEISSLQSAVYSSGEPKLTFILLRNSRFVSEVSKSTKQSPKS